MRACGRLHLLRIFIRCKHLYKLGRFAYLYPVFGGGVRKIGEKRQKTRFCGAARAYALHHVFDNGVFAVYNIPHINGLRSDFFR